MKMPFADRWIGDADKNPAPTLGGDDDEMASTQLFVAVHWRDRMDRAAGCFSGLGRGHKLSQRGREGAANLEGRRSFPPHSRYPYPLLSSIAPGRDPLAPCQQRNLRGCPARGLQ